MEVELERSFKRDKQISDKTFQKRMVYFHYTPSGANPLMQIMSSLVYYYSKTNGNVYLQKMIKNQNLIKRRILNSFHAYQTQDFEGSLIHYFPALDATAKLRYTKKGVGWRIKRFLRDERDLVTAVGLGMIIKNLSIHGYTFEEAIYKFGRNSIVHEGELDPRLKFTDRGKIEIGEYWELPKAYILGLIVAVIACAENSNKKSTGGESLVILNKRFLVSDLWGKEAELRDHLSSRFGAVIIKQNSLHR